MPRADHRRLLDVVDKLYAATLDSSQWQVFLGSLASMFEAQNAFICEVEHKTRALDYIGLPQLNRDRLPVKRYETLINEDPRTPIFRRHSSRAAHCRMGISTAQLHASRAYREYLHPLNIEYTMVMLLPVRQGVTHDLGLTRDRRGVAFGGGDCDLLNELAPHLSRAFAIRRALNAKIKPQSPLVQEPQGDLEKLQQMFLLAPSEARLSLLLFNGLTVREAAERLALTEGTARQYLKRIFAKTGARRQLDLIRGVGKTLSDR